MITIKNLHKSFGNHEILRGINTQIKTGEKVVILGKSGCGKSTLLRCINLLEHPSSGQIFINNCEITNPKTNINKIRLKIGMVFQNFNLFPHLSILQNITLAPIHLKLKSPLKANQTALALLNRIGLSNKANMFPHQLSGGQQQRVAIVRALAIDPEIMLLDEPTSSLDPTMVGEVFALIKELAHSGITMITVTHSMDFAKDIANKILFMDSGSIIEENTPQNFFSNPKTPQALDFISILH